MRFIQTHSSSGGETLEIDCVSPPTGVKEPEHVHPFQENKFRIRSGSCTFSVRGVERLVEAGDSISIPANTPHFWAALCELAELPELAADPRYDTVKKRAQYASEIVPKLRAALAKRTALEWEARFGERVPCAASRTEEDMFDFPQVRALGLIDTYEHAKAGRFRGFREPVGFGGGLLPTPRAAPLFGEHSREVLAQAGYGQPEIDALLESGAVPAPEAPQPNNSTRRRREEQ